MRRRAVLLIIATAVALVAATGVALAADITCPNSIGNLCVGTDQADTMTGTDQGDDMRGLGGRDTMHARDGDDKLSGGDGSDDISAGPGDDPFIKGAAGDDSLSGGDGYDSYVFGKSWGGDTITTGETSGEDTLDFSSHLEPLDVDLVSSAGRDEVFSDTSMLNFPAAVEIENVKGGEARDVVRGNDVPNHLSGNAGNDSLVGRGNDDVLSGDLGADSFNGGTGNDVLDGGNGIDGDVYIFQDGWGNDSITDSAGTNRLLFSELTASVTVDLAAGTATDGTNTVTWTPLGIENATGGTAIDRATGGTAADFLYGNGSVNTLNGQAGDDTIDVADGDPGDTVDCGPGVADVVKVDAESGPGGTVPLDTDIRNCETITEVLIPPTV